MSAINQLAVLAAYPAAIWSFVVLVVQGLGAFQIFRNYSRPPPKPVSPTLPREKTPHVTIIRPVSGLDPQLYECLVSTFRQSYPKDKLTIYFCIESEDDPAYPVLEKAVDDFPDFDARIFVQEYDPLLSGLEGHAENLGPNPKVRNISRAYREAKGDIIWIIDCNVWVGNGVAGRMVDKLMGYLPEGKTTTPYKFVHLLPLVVDIASRSGGESQQMLSSASESSPTASAEAHAGQSTLSYVKNQGGGRLEEMFMATTHAKFYGAINTVGVAPCIVGKSNMFRKSHLDRYTDPGENANLKPADADRGRGIDFFSSYICEDHLIGDLLWKADIPGFRRHGLVSGDLAIQPMAGMSVRAYWARRVRWLRVRKWTVLAATLVEPGVESLLCSLYLSFALTTIPWFSQHWGIPQTWGAMAAIWVTGVSLWMSLDRVVYRRLHACQSVEADDNTPAFARGTSRPGGVQLKPFSEWPPAWAGRETLALPIWTWAVLLGRTVRWRGKDFIVHHDMSVEAVKSKPKTQSQAHATPFTKPAENGLKRTTLPETKENQSTGRERPTSTRRRLRSNYSIE